MKFILKHSTLLPAKKSWTEIFAETLAPLLLGIDSKLPPQ
jgi:hypothetical protein